MSSSAPTGRQLELTCWPVVTSPLRHRSDDSVMAAPVVVSIVVAVVVVVSATVPVVEPGVSSEAVVVDVGLGVVVML